MTRRPPATDYEGPATQPMKNAFERIQADADAANQRSEATISGALAPFESPPADKTE